MRNQELFSSSQHFWQGTADAKGSVFSRWTQVCGGSNGDIFMYSWARNHLRVLESDSSSAQAELGAAPGDISWLYGSVCSPSTRPLAPAEIRQEAGGKTLTDGFCLQTRARCPRLRNCRLLAPLPHAGAIRQHSSFYRTTPQAYAEDEMPISSSCRFLPRLQAATGL